MSKTEVYLKLSSKQVRSIVEEFSEECTSWREMDSFVAFVLKQYTKWSDADWERVKRIADKMIKYNDSK